MQLSAVGITIDFYISNLPVVAVAASIGKEAKTLALFKV